MTRAAVTTFAIATLLGDFPAAALAAPGQPYKGAIPPEVRAHLEKEMDLRPPADYFQRTPATLIDLNGDGTPELIVDAGCDDQGFCKFGLYEKKGGAYQVIGEEACQKSGYKLEKGKGAWMTFVCGDGIKSPFDEGAHHYGYFHPAAKTSPGAGGRLEQGVALYKAGKYAEAQKALESLTVDGKQYGELCYWRGLAKYRAGDRKGGKKDLYEASNAGYALADLASADLYWEEGSASAVPTYKDYLSHGGNDAEGVARAKRRINGEEKLPAPKAHKK